MARNRSQAALCCALVGAMGFLGEPLPEVLRCGACLGSAIRATVEPESDSQDAYTPSDGCPEWRPPDGGPVM